MERSVQERTIARRDAEKENRRKPKLLSKLHERMGRDKPPNADVLQKIYAKEEQRFEEEQKMRSRLNNTRRQIQDEIRALQEAVLRRRQAQSVLSRRTRVSTKALIYQTLAGRLQPPPLGQNPRYEPRRLYQDPHAFFLHKQRFPLNNQGEARAKGLSTDGLPLGQLNAAEYTLNPSVLADQSLSQHNTVHCDLVLPSEEEGSLNLTSKLPNISGAQSNNQRGRNNGEVEQGFVTLPRIQDGSSEDAASKRRSDTRPRPRIDTKGKSSQRSVSPNKSTPSLCHVLKERTVLHAYDSKPSQTSREADCKDIPSSRSHMKEICLNGSTHKSVISVTRYPKHSRNPKAMQLLSMAARQERAMELESLIKQCESEERKTQQQLAQSNHEIIVARAKADHFNDVVARVDDLDFAPPELLEYLYFQKQHEEVELQNEMHVILSRHKIRPKPKRKMKHSPKTRLKQQH